MGARAGRSGLAILFILPLALLIIVAASGPLSYRVSNGGGPKISPRAEVPIPTVPARSCTCSEGVSPASSSQGHSDGFRGRGPPNLENNYDEQIGMTFTENFTSIAYNVTAVEQTDPTLGTGPAYLLNGLADSGYWYQVGLSYDWSPGTNFSMNYEVFDPTGASIYPRSGGGLEAFSGPVDPGDLVLLNVYFTNSSQVVMLAQDLNTTAQAAVEFSSFGGTFFEGTPASVANSNGFFTGLMTEWYHGVPYYANPEQAIYSNPGFALTSAWLWMDEFDPATNQLVFSANTTSPLIFTAPAQLQEFSYNGTTEFADAYELVTGASTQSTTTTSTSYSNTSSSSATTNTVSSSASSSSSSQSTNFSVSTSQSTSSSTATATTSTSSSSTATSSSIVVSSTTSVATGTQVTTTTTASSSVTAPPASLIPILTTVAQILTLLLAIVEVFSTVL